MVLDPVGLRPRLNAVAAARLFDGLLAQIKRKEAFLGPVARIKTEKRVSFP